MEIRKNFDVDIMQMSKQTQTSISLDHHRIQIHYYQ